MKLHLLYLLGVLFLLFCKPAVTGIIDATDIVAGTSKITGKITTSDPNNKDIYVIVFVPHPISGETVQYKAVVDQTGKFSIDAEVETAISLVGVSIGLNPEKSLFVKLTNGGTTNIDIAYNSNSDIENVQVTPAMNKSDVIRGQELMGRMISYRSGRPAEALHEKSTDYFLAYVKMILSERLAVLEKDTLVSAELKEILSKDFRLFLYNAHVFDYSGQMTLNYGNLKGNKSEKPEIKKIDRSYFRFLKDFNLNDPQYLYNSEFPRFQKAILQNEILGLPEIAEDDIPVWLAKVKTILSELVGFDSGPYYDILVANAYARQLNEQVKPLSDKQKKNISDYWKQGEIAKLLFRKNQQVVEWDKFKSPAVVKSVVSVPKNKVIETIVSRHKGKIVLIDLWATWCVPCLDAMQEFRSTKGEFRGKDVAFVYLTNGSSPRQLWEEKIKGIGDEHYYLTTDQWNYMMAHFKLDYIPSYLLYNKKGMLIEKITAFPGKEQLKVMINDQL